MKSKSYKFLTTLLTTFIILTLFSGCKSKPQDSKQEIASSNQTVVSSRDKNQLNENESYVYETEKQAALNQILENVNTIKYNNFQISSKEKDLTEARTQKSSVQSSLYACNNNLANAKEQLKKANLEKVRVYKSGIGWTYMPNETAIANAQKLVDQYQNQCYQLQTEESRLQLQISTLENDIKNLKNENNNLNSKNTTLKNKYNIA